MMRNSSTACTKHKDNGARTATPEVVRKHRLRWRCGCCCSSMYATGAMTPWSGKSGPTSPIAIFCRIGLGKVPDAKTLARIEQAITGEVIGDLHRRLVELAREKDVIAGRKMRVDTTVVETNIHYPTDSSLLGDRARVLTRTMTKIETRAGKLKRSVRNRMRSVNKRVIAIAFLRGAKARTARKIGRSITASCSA